MSTDEERTRKMEPWENPEYKAGGYRDNPRADYLVCLYVNAQYDVLCDRGEELVDEANSLRVKLVAAEARAEQAEQLLDQLSGMYIKAKTITPFEENFLNNTVGPVVESARRVEVIK